MHKRRRCGAPSVFSSQRKSYWCKCQGCRCKHTRWFIICFCTHTQLIFQCRISQLAAAYEQIKTEYASLALHPTSNTNWQVLSSHADGSAVSLLEHPTDPSCPYVRMTSVMPGTIQDVWVSMKFCLLWQVLCILYSIQECISIVIASSGLS